MINTERYSRQIRLIGEQAQETLRSTTLLQVGLGGLGSPLAYYLAAAGIGKIIFFETDTVEESNLGRQILYSPTDIGKSKIEIAQAQLVRFNPEIEMIFRSERFTRKVFEEMKDDVDIIVDASDNLKTKYLVNDLAIKYGKQFSIASLWGYSGQIFNHIPGSGCLRCLYGAPDESRKTQGIGIIGATCGVVGTLQASEIIKMRLTPKDASINQVLSIDLDNLALNKAAFHPDVTCMCQK